MAGESKFPFKPLEKTPDLARTDTPPAAKVKVFACPNCGGNVEVRAEGQTLASVCAACKSVIDVSDENHQIISQFDSKATIKPLIAIGSRGKLKGTLWEVIGFLRRRDTTWNFYWDEYLLFNPYKGFRWLSTSDGHWNFITTTKEKPKKSYSTASNSQWMQFLDRKYKLFHRGKAEVTFVLGEFYWRVKQKETADIEDYICPPEVLSCESSNNEITWSVGEYLKREDVMQAFKLQGFPDAQGVAPNQPSAMSGHLGRIWKIYGAVILLLLLLNIVFASCSANKQVFSKTYQWQPSESTSWMSESFELDKAGANLELMISASVDNDWFEADIDLIEDSSGKSYASTLGVEYYHGYDSDGSWSEGSRSSSALITDLPAGKYHFVVTPNGFSNNSQKHLAQTIDFEARSDVAHSDNFWMALMLLTIYPLLTSISGYRFEVARWKDSDFAPAQYSLTERED